MPTEPLIQERAPADLSRRAVMAGAVSVALASRPGFGVESSLLSDIVAAFDRERLRRNVPSISVALVENGSASLCQRGLASASRRNAIGPDTQYQAASISKTVAAVTVIALGVAGRISLDADVSTYLKRWHLPQLPPGGSKAVTLRRLFGMTAGCNVPGFLGYPVGVPTPDLVHILEGTPPANSLPVRIVTPPGSVRAYSGGGCQIAQLAIEDATGRAFADLAGTLVLRPLAMHRSGFFQPPNSSQEPGCAIAHDDDGREIAGGWHVYPELAAAGLWSTPADLAQLILAAIAAYRGDTNTVFGKDGLAAMFSSVDGLGYGIGVALAGDGDRRIAMKRGNNFGYRNGLVACPASGQGAVVMTNGNDGEEIVNAVLDALARKYAWPAHAPWPE